MTTILDCTAYLLVIAGTGLLFAGITDADFIAAFRAMRARLERTLRAWQRRDDERHNL